MAGSTPLRVWLILSFIVDMLFGVPLLLVPHDIAAVFGFVDQGVFVLRLLGAAFIGLGLGSMFVCREREEWAGFEAIVHLKIVWTILSALAILWSIFDGAPRSAWLFFGIFCVFAIGWIYFGWKIKKIP